MTFEFKKPQRLSNYKFRDISWMMSLIDVVAFCEKMGWEIKGLTGDWILSYCPDHHIMTGRFPSHPKFYLNQKTGKTFCHTESRASNLVEIISRLKKCSLDDAFKFITGSDIDDDNMRLQYLSKRTENLQNEPAAEEKILNLDRIETDIRSRKLSEKAYEYFMNPPNKKPSLISRETVDYFKVFERNYGYYKNRVIIPVYCNKILTGFTAIDFLGESKWLIANLDKIKDDYKKVLYPKGFKSGRNLFGYDEVEHCPDMLIVVEGPRDMMKAWQLGYKNTVALFGTNLTLCHLRLISEKSPRQVIVFFDGDEAGIMAAEKVAKKLTNFFETYIAVTPRSHDPKTLEPEEFAKTMRKKIKIV